MHSRSKAWREARDKLSELPEGMLLDILIDEGDALAIALDAVDRDRNDCRDMLKGIAANIGKMLAPVGP